MQNNLACTYTQIGRVEQASCILRDVYSGRLKLSGEESLATLAAASNYASSLVDLPQGLQRFEEAKSLLRTVLPVARRVLSESNEITLKMRWIYAKAHYKDSDATLDDLREAVTTLEDAGRIARRVFGGAHPLTTAMEDNLRQARAALRARETLAEAMASTTLGDA